MRKRKTEFNLIKNNTRIEISIDANHLVGKLDKASISDIEVSRQCQQMITNSVMLLMPKIKQVVVTAWFDEEI